MNKTLLYRSPMLCSHCFSGYFWRIRDKTTPWSHRIKLCRYAWGHENVYIPNKHQALLDWITYAVQERHKYGRINNLVSVKISLQVIFFRMTKEDSLNVWRFFRDIMNTKVVQQPKQHKNLSLKIKIAQVGQTLIFTLIMLAQYNTITHFLGFGWRGFVIVWSLQISCNCDRSSFVGMCSPNIALSCLRHNIYKENRLARNYTA